MNNLHTLYGRDKKGGFKVWNISVEGAVITVEHGKLGGKQTSKVSPPCKPKNVGRANETTPEQQALSEAHSKWQKQVDKGYGTDKNSLPEGTLPPLAKKYVDAPPKLSLEKPWFGSYKLNGVRCTIFKRNGGQIEFQTRGGKTYPVIQEIADELTEIFFGLGDDDSTLVVDGELYGHGMFLEDITSAVKKHNDDTPKINFHVFDVHDTKDKCPLQLRHQIYITWMQKFDCKRVKPVQQRPIISHEMVEKFHAVAVEKGYEGIVLRCPKSVFKFNYRTAEFIKYKIDMSDEFEVIGFEKDKNGCALPILLTHCGKEFKAPMKGAHPFKQQLWKDRETHVGRHMTVDFESYSKYAIPLKPISQAFRELDEEGNPET